MSLGLAGLQEDMRGGLPEFQGDLGRHGMDIGPAPYAVGPKEFSVDGHGFSFVNGWTLEGVVFDGGLGGFLEDGLWHRLGCDNQADSNGLIALDPDIAPLRTDPHFA